MRVCFRVILVLLAIPWAAHAQFRDNANLDRKNRHLAGRIVDYSHNHDADRRLYSPLLGMPRDLYVYLPPGYNPSCAYPLIVYLHMAYVDEHTFVGSNRIRELDRMICRGEFPPVIVAAPDGTIRGENDTDAQHSMFVNGCHGRFEDHVLREVIPFVMSKYSVRPEREAHALLGASAGAFGALNLAITNHDFFGAVATLAAPANLRYTTVSGDYHENFNPATFRWNSRYDPDQVIGQYYLGLRKVHAGKFLDPVFGCGPDVVGRIVAENPADLIVRSDLKPGELDIYLNYPGRDHYNFDAQVESFAWLARQKGISVTTERVPHRRHGLMYFVNNHKPAFQWLACRLLPPVPGVRMSP